MKNYFDFKEDQILQNSFAADYLRQYYHPSRKVTDNESAVYKFICDNSFRRNIILEYLNKQINLKQIN